MIFIIIIKQDQFDSNCIKLMPHVLFTFWDDGLGCIFDKVGFETFLSCTDRRAANTKIESKTNTKNFLNIAFS